MKRWLSSIVFIVCCYGFFVDFIRGIYSVVGLWCHATYVAGKVRLPAYQLMVQWPVKTHTCDKCIPSVPNQTELNCTAWWKRGFEILLRPLIKPIKNVFLLTITHSDFLVFITKTFCSLEMAYLEFCTLPHLGYGYARMCYFSLLTFMLTTLIHCFRVEFQSSSDF